MTVATSGAALRSVPETESGLRYSDWRGETVTVDKRVRRAAHDLELIRRGRLGLDPRIIWPNLLGEPSRENAY